MICNKLFLFLSVVHLCCCDWADEWMSPIQQQINGNPSRRINRVETKQGDYYDSNLKTAHVADSNDESGAMVPRAKDLSTATLKAKLENALENAEELIETLRVQIQSLSARENMIKDAIANGRSGVTTVTVFTLHKPPRSYLVNDGTWTLCNGMIQLPTANVPTSLFKELFTAPRCIGQEVASIRDPCVFNSVIKYETIPTRRRLEYTEDDYLCLKPSFNHTLEQYLSVPKTVVNETCLNGVVRSVPENVQQCGQRMLSEYTYYPDRSAEASQLPLEYCIEKDRSCKMIVAWHVSNVSVENFEFIKNEQNFKKYFINSAHY